MITVPATRLQQFSSVFYQAALSVNDVNRLVRFEVLSFGERKGKRRKKKSRAGVHWEELEKRISGSGKAYQRPILRKKIDELVRYYRERMENNDIAPIPGAVILVADKRLEFKSASRDGPLGHLFLPEEEGILRTLDGQHRLLALAAFQDAEAENPIAQQGLRDLLVPAVVFDHQTSSHSVEMFVTINTKHTKLKKDVVVSLSGRRLYEDKNLAVAHDIIRSLNDRQDSPLQDDIRLLGVGKGRVSQAPLASEIQRLFQTYESAGGGAAKKFKDESRDFFLKYFKQVSQVFPKAWNGRKYSLKRGTALRAFIRVVPDVINAARSRGLDVHSARDLGSLLEPWAERIGDARFETEGEWRMKSAGGGASTIDILARELRDALM